MTTTAGPRDRRTSQAPLRDAAPAVPDAPGPVRERLYDDLAPLLATRLGVVLGMAGTGKTTALAHWARQLREEVVWCRATHGTDLVGLASAVAARTRPPLLVVDDFHRTTTRADCERLEEVLLGTRARLVVLTRETPPFNLARSELPGRVVHASTLRFRAEETAELYRTYGAPLSDADAGRLTHHTAGWPAAIRLFHHSLDGADAEDRHRAVAALPGTASYAEQYLTTEVLAGLDTRDRDLLRRTSVLDLLTGVRCDALLGTQDSGPRLSALCRTGIVAEDDAGYRLHPVVRSHLCEQLRAEIGSAGMGVLERRCARLLEVE